MLGSKTTLGQFTILVEAANSFFTPVVSTNDFIQKVFGAFLLQNIHGYLCIQEMKFTLF
jgi:hypothetical protein